MQEMSENMTVFRLRPPEPLPYKLLIYAKEVHETEPVVPEGTPKESVYGAVCEYKLIATGFKREEALPPYPPCQSSSYGANEVARRYALTTDLRGAIVQARSGIHTWIYFLQTSLIFLLNLLSRRILSEIFSELFEFISELFSELFYFYWGFCDENLLISAEKFGISCRVSRYANCRCNGAQVEYAQVAALHGEAEDEHVDGRYAAGALRDHSNPA